MSRELKWINHEKVLYALDECSKVYKTATQSNHFSVKHEQRADLYWLLISYFFSPIVLVMVNQSSNRSNNSINSTKLPKKTDSTFFLYSHARKQSILKEMLSREMAEPGPGPSSVLNCSQNLRRDRSLLTASLPVNGRRTSSKIMWGRTYNAQRKVTFTFGTGCALCAI